MIATVSDAFEVPAAKEASGEGAGTRARAHARLAVTDGDSKRSWVAAAGRVVAGDVRAAWPWHGAPPALAQLVADRVPDIAAVPGANRALWAAWVCWNHAVLPVVLVGYGLLWALMHPARFVLAAVVAAPLIFIWI